MQLTVFDRKETARFRLSIAEDRSLFHGHQSSQVMTLKKLFPIMAQDMVTEVLTDEITRLPPFRLTF